MAEHARVRPTAETQRIYVVLNETESVVCMAYTDPVAATEGLRKFRAVSPERKFSMVSTVLVRELR